MFPLKNLARKGLNHRGYLGFSDWIFLMQFILLCVDQGYAVSLPLSPKAEWVLSLPASGRPSTRSCDPDCLRDSLRNIFQIFLKPWLDYSLSKYLWQVWWWVSQLIKYAHNWPKVTDNFAFLESFFKLKFDTVWSFTRLFDISDEFYGKPIFVF